MIDRHDFERLRGLDDEMTDICNIRVAFAADIVHDRYLCLIISKFNDKYLNNCY